MKNKIVFLSGLNGIRAIAAIGVLLSHINLALNKFNIFNVSLFGFTEDTSKAYVLGEHGVTMFFVLSGFLITYLLIKEFNIKKTINIKAFYVRRILRIWPLYYLYIALCLIFFVTSYSFSIDYNINYYLFFLANVPGFNENGFPAMHHLWSIGVEEQFYLFWPFLFTVLIKRKFILNTFLIILMLSLFRIGIWYFLPFSKIALISLVNRFDCMLFGALGAYLFIKNSKIISVLDSKVFQSFCWVILFALILNVFQFLNSIIEIFLIELVVIGIIIGQINLKNRIFNLEKKIFSYLGKISFGIYVYHPLLILFFSTFLKFDNQMNIITYTILLFLLIIFSTIVLSHVSFFYFEKRFLKLKSRYSIVKSTNDFRNV
jgi:peptidoglycan/LPS O-acetylase OafA/YrhL